ncbi:MAG: glycosyltransferase family 39 protein [Chloroflexi bacterium]|nr:glycosyltransferase family 39 protein [Chloroflexota bacterium]
MLAAWARLTGGFDAFGFSTHSGRALMLICHAVSLAFVYGITRKLTKSDTAAIVAALIFMFSPLTIGYQRRVLLENLMLPSLLGAIYLLVGDRRTLTHYLLSAILFGLAVLTKFAVLGFLPALLLFIRMRSDRYHRGFAVNLWFALAAFLILLFPLYANMKQELFPEGWLFGGDFPHVSLLESLADRGPSNGAFLNFGAGWNTSFQQWTDITNITADPILLYGGLLASVFVLVMAWDKRNRDLRRDDLHAVRLSAVCHRRWNGLHRRCDSAAAHPRNQRRHCGGRGLQADQRPFRKHPALWRRGRGDRSAALPLHHVLQQPRADLQHQSGERSGTGRAVAAEQHAGRRGDRNG